MTPGGNNPPDMTVIATDTMHDISAWAAENPVIQTEESAKEAKLFIDRGKLAIQDLEDERDGKVRPLNEQVKEINFRYKSPKEALQRTIFEVSSRLSTFLREEERKRIAILAEARRIAEEAERRAREAEAAEQAAIGSVNSGELGIDIAAHVVASNDAIREAQVAARQAARAERETHVKVAGGFSKAISLREKETLIVANAMEAIRCLGATEDIKEAIIKSARLYRKLNGKLPEGITVEIERGI